MKIEMGKVYLIGAGPGDPELLTLKAVNLLQKANVVFYDQLVSSRVLKYCNNEAELIYVGKKRSRHSVEQSSLNELLLEYSKKFPIIIRLKGGDPSIFGRVGEEYLYLLENSVDTEIIAGITTASGVAASIGLPLTHRDYSDKIFYLTAHQKEGIRLEHLKNLSLEKTTLVIYMGLYAAEEISKTILLNSKNHSIPVLLVENATLQNERIFTCTIEYLKETIESKQIQSPAIIIIGEIVKFYLLKEEILQKNKKSTKKT